MSYLQSERVVVLVDMDCFYCQVEEKLNPLYKGKPLAVVQYNAWRGGGIIAVNYEARNRGVTRHMRGDEAKRKCPEIILAQVPNVRGKADLTKYRDAGKLVANVLQTFTSLIERASVDEAYLDITESVRKRFEMASKDIALNEIANTHVVASSPADFLHNLYNAGLVVQGNLLLAYGGVIVEEIRATVFAQTGYTCSAGIAHSKILAKLACGLNKPNKQTILPQNSVEELYKDLPVCKIRSLGGKFGNSVSEHLGIVHMIELAKFTEKQLRQHYDEKTASWLYNVARGIDLEPVTKRLLSKSIGCCKKFPGRSALTTIESVTHWIDELTLEIVERLEKDLEENNRKAKQMVVSFSQEVRGKDVANSRTYPLNAYDTKRIAIDAFEIIKKNCQKSSGTFCIKYLGISAGKFEDCRNVNNIASFFKIGDAAKMETKKDDVDELANHSDTTVDLDEDIANLEFFNEKPIDNGSVSDSDSISNELCNETTKVDELKSKVEPEEESFFLKYFENLKKQKCASPANRDFDTSRILVDVPEDDDDEGKSMLEIPGTRETFKVCDECSRRVPITEWTLHMDRHYAYKIVREEAHLYTNTSKLTAQPIVKKKTKRKLPNMKKNATLESYLKSDLADDGVTCPQCNKKVEPGAFESHSDYHLAKKLHMEINPAKSCIVTNKIARKGKSEKSRSVRDFFKPAS